MTPGRPTLLLRPTTGGLVAVVLVLGLGLLSSLTGSRWLSAGAAAVVGLGAVCFVAGVAGASRLQRTHAHLVVPVRTAVGERSPARLVVVLPPGSTGLELAGRVEQDGLEPVALVLAAGPGDRVVDVVVDRLAVVRGRSEVARVRLVVTDPLHLVRWVLDLHVPAPVLVRPRRVRPADLPLAAGTHEGGTRTVRSRTGDLAAVRGWQRGDSRRDLHRRATARTGTPVVVLREDVATSPRVGVLLVGAVGDDRDERRLALAAATAAQVRAQSPDAPVAAAHPGGVERAPVGPPSVVLDWWAGVVLPRTPGAVDVAAAVRSLGAGTDVVLAVATDPGTVPGAAHDRSSGPMVRWVR